MSTLSQSTRLLVPSSYEGQETKDDPFVVSLQNGAKYAQMFASVGTEGGYLDGGRAAHLLSKCGLPQETLAKIWAVSDEDADGRLSIQVSTEDQVQKRRM